MWVGVEKQPTVDEPSAAVKAEVHVGRTPILGHLVVVVVVLVVVVGD